MTSGCIQRHFIKWAVLLVLVQFVDVIMNQCHVQINLLGEVLSVPGRFPWRRGQVPRHTRLNSPGIHDTVGVGSDVRIVDIEGTINLGTSGGEFTLSNLVILGTRIEPRNKLLIKTSVIATWELRQKWLR